MILVTVGTHSANFNRLVLAADEMARQIEEQVIIQYGSSTRPQYAQGLDFIPSDQINALTREARVVISHAAAGSIITTLLAGKPLVVVPRQKANGEMLDDHQFQLARALNETRRAIAIYEPTAARLRSAIEAATSTLDRPASSTPQMILALRKELEQVK